MTDVKSLGRSDPSEEWYERFRDSTLRGIADMGADGAAKGIADAGVVGDLNGVRWRMGELGPVLSRAMAGDVVTGEAVIAGDCLFIGVPVALLTSSSMVSTVIGRTAIEVSNASVGELKVDDETEFDI